MNRNKMTQGNFPASMKRFGQQAGGRKGVIPGVRDISKQAKTYAVGVGGEGVEVAKIFGQNLIGKKLNFKLSAGGTYANGVIPILPQYADDALPTGVTFSGSNFASYAAFAKFVVNAKLVLGRLQVSTDDTDNFSEAIKVTTVTENGSSSSVTETWDSLAIDLNAQVQGTRIIDYTGWICGDVFNRYEINTMTDDTYLAFTFVIVGVGGRVIDAAAPLM